MLGHGYARKYHLQVARILILVVLALGNVGYSGFGCISLETNVGIWLHMFGSPRYRLLTGMHLLDVITVCPEGFGSDDRLELLEWH